LEFNPAPVASAPRAHWLHGDFLADAIVPATPSKPGTAAASTDGAYLLENFDPSHVAIEDGVALKAHLSSPSNKHRALRPDYVGN
jgi:hypothetical protein